MRVALYCIAVIAIVTNNDGIALGAVLVGLMFEFLSGDPYERD